MMDLLQNKLKTEIKQTWNRYNLSELSLHWQANATEGFEGSVLGAGCSKRVSQILTAQLADAWRGILAVILEGMDISENVGTCWQIGNSLINLTHIWNLGNYILIEKQVLLW